MTTTIAGVKRNGLDAASYTIAQQLPLIKKDYPEISNCFAGTINIQLDSDLLIVNADHTTLPLNWANSFYEVFSFLKVVLKIPRLNKSYEAWIYVPYNSPHRMKLNFHEILSEKIENIGSCEYMEIDIDKNVTCLKYQFRNIYVV